MSKDDMIGKKYGRLTVESYYGSNKHRNRLWLCKCECGNETIVSTTKLNKGETKSCGCLYRECEDLTGQRFGFLTAIKRVEKPSHIKGRTAFWLCRCDCGNEKITSSQSLKSGGTRTCGHHNKGVDGTNYRHGLQNTRLSNIYHGMKQRCNNPKAFRYDYYGGRGIKVCDEWNKSDGLKNFGDWALANGYADDLTLDRIDTNGNYEPSNCRWVSRETQAQNTRANIQITYKGKTMVLSEWSRELGISYSTMQSSLRRGKTIEEIVFLHEKRKTVNT